MEFEWDEAKRTSNAGKHGLDLAFGAELFDGRPVFEYPSSVPGEERWVTVGLLMNKLVAVIWTLRGDRIRVISLRSARDGEKKEYRTRHLARN